jgi:bifunctional non-homologous end joining protein LigD
VTAYSARASAFAGVSAALTWQELEEGETPQDFTMRTMPGRIQIVGDMWPPCGNRLGRI